MQLHFAFHVLEEASEWLHVPYPTDTHPRYNIVPGQRVLGVCNDAATRYSWLHWDLTGIAHAPAERLVDGGLYERALLGQRCIVPSTGFYLWTKDGTPHFVGRNDRKPLFFAGLWFPPLSSAPSEDRACVLLTAPADEALRPLAPRMPLLLRRGAWRPWLARERRAVDDLLPLLSSDTTIELTTYPVGPLVLDRTADRRECLRPVHPA